MRVALSVSASLIATSLQAASLWDHNGSTVTLEAGGNARKFVYEKPREGLPVSRGTVLFQGVRAGNEYKGKAFSFSQRCGKIAFDVSGPLSNDERGVTLYGKSPLRGPNCQTVGFKDEVLSFNLQSAPTKYVLKLGTSAFGFHIPQKLFGQTLNAVPPTNEHTIFSIEDMYSVIGAQLDVLVAETDTPINNAYAVIDGSGDKARRLIVFDNEWFSQLSQRGGAYRVILAHEVGHHVCRHTLGEFRDQPLEKELQADRAAGAILRKARDKGAAIGGSDGIGLNEMIDTARAALPVSASLTHPAQESRIAAMSDGWNRGSPCLDGKYETVNLPPPREISAAERIVIRYGNDLVWSHNHFFEAGHSYMRTEVDGNKLRIVFDKPSAEMVKSGVRRGMVMFEGVTGKETITGTITRYMAGCAPVTYPAVSGTFVENNFLGLVGPPPKVEGCQVVGSFPNTLHVFKNTSDYSFQAPASR